MDYYHQKISGLMLQCCFIIMGYTLTEDQINSSLTPDLNHYLLHNPYWVVQIIEHPIERESSMKVVATLEKSLTDTLIRETVLLYFKKDKGSKQLKYGDILLINSNIATIAAAKNPNQFNYKKMMQRRRIFFTGYVRSGGWTKIGRKIKNPIKYCAGNAQNKLAKIFAESGVEGDEYSIITAILLGADDDMDPELKKSYASAGVSHILCVSGMHVGIIFMILNFVLKPMELTKQTKFLKSIILLIIIWLYANVTGLSPSVRRAATMFSFVTLGGLLRRNTNIFHSLLASLFILLAIKPALLFELGFQLSYSAVFGIVLFQKPLMGLFHIQTRVGSYFCELMTVSCAAQLATFPLSVYYFGQFPNYFLLANLSVISLSFVVVITGVVLLVVSFIPIITKWVAVILTMEIKLMNIMIAFIDSLPGSVTDHISISVVQMLLFYVVIMAVFLWLVSKKKNMVWVALSSMLLISMLFTCDRVRTQKLESVTVYHISRHQAINFNYHGNSILLADSLLDKGQSAYSFSIANHERKDRIKSQIIAIEDSCFENNYFAKRGNFVNFNGKTYYLLRKRQKIYPSSHKIKVDYLVLLERNIQLKWVHQAIEYGAVIEAFD